MRRLGPHRPGLGGRRSRRRRLHGGIVRLPGRGGQGGRGTPAESEDGHEADQRQRHHVHRDRRRGAVGPEQRGRGDRGHGAADHAAHLVGDGDPAVPEPDVEDLGEKATLGAGHDALDERGHDEGEQRQTGVPGVDQREHWDRPEHGGQGAQRVDLLRAEAVGGQGRHDDGADPDQRRGEDQREQRRPVEAHHRGAVGEHVDDDRVADRRRGDRGQAGEHEVAWLAAEQLRDRDLADRLVLLHLLELRCVLQPGADQETDDHQRDADQEGDPPAVGHEVLVGHARDGEEGQVRGEDADRHAELGEAPVDRTAPRGGVLGGDQDRAAPLAADPEALDQTERDQQQRRADADGGVRGQDTDEERRAAGQQQGEDEHRLSADPVPVVTDDRGPQRAGDEADGEGREGGERAGHAGELGVEEAPEHQRRGGAEDVVVVPLDRRADEAGREDALLGRGTGRAGWGHGCVLLWTPKGRSACDHGGEGGLTAVGMQAGRRPEVLSARAYPGSVFCGIRTTSCVPSGAHPSGRVSTVIGTSSSRGPRSDDVQASAVVSCSALVIRSPGMP